MFFHDFCIYTIILLLQPQTILFIQFHCWWCVPFLDSACYFVHYCRHHSADEGPSACLQTAPPVDTQLYSHEMKSNNTLWWVSLLFGLYSVIFSSSSVCQLHRLKCELPFKYLIISSFSAVCLTSTFIRSAAAMAIFSFFSSSSLSSSITPSLWN